MTLQEMIQDTLRAGGHDEVAGFIRREEERQHGAIELIASENFPSDAVKAAAASDFVAKYTEGYPKERVSGNRGRYYGGCENADQLEEYCCRKWKQVFSTDYHVNVQPHSGSSANLAAFLSVLQPGDTVLAMSLENGGHLTHGSPVNFSGRLFDFHFYDVDGTGRIRYEAIGELLEEYQPKLVLAGASAYSREIDFARIGAIIDRYAAAGGQRPWFMVDMAHIAGLIAAGVHQSPFGVADIITTTTHKTLRGTRGGLIFCRPELAKKVDSAVFPGSQGGPLQHIIAAKAVTADEDCTEEYHAYIRRVVANTKAMCDEFVRMGYDVVTGGTDNHLFLVDFSRTHPQLTGKAAQNMLDEAGITLNKNCVPNEKRSPVETSGVRIGCAAMTTKGYGEEDFRAVARRIDQLIRDYCARL